MTHTPTPWILDESHKHDREGVTIWKDDMIIADVVDDQHGQAKANAAFIIRAVNAHDDLLKWAKTFRRFILSLHEGEDDAPTITLKELEASIAKAEAR